MKHFSLLCAAIIVVVLLIVGNIFSKVPVQNPQRTAVNTAPTTGFATVNGKEIRYYVTGDKRFLNIDTQQELQVCQYNISNIKPEGFTGSFQYKDQQGDNRMCHYKILETISKKNMVPAHMAAAHKPTT